MLLIQDLKHSACLNLHIHAEIQLERKSWQYLLPDPYRHGQPHSVIVILAKQ